MKINQAGIELIKHFEGLCLEAYEDAVGVLTIGFGHTGSDVPPKGQKIDLNAANDLLEKDLAKFESGVARLLKVSVTENQFSALVCFSFNAGLENLKNSTLLKVLNNGNKTEAAFQFTRWNRAGNKVLKGLSLRREAEQALFLK